ncbi:MAG: SulP family inorganic anion transporter [Gammaproteobacteria bacterium]|jgi:SulP family sulfate permease
MTHFIHGLHFKNIRGDIYGGLTAAIVALPLALAFGVSSGAGPVAGIYGAIFVGFFAALFGGTPAQISGPTGPMTVVMTAIFTQYTGLYPDDPQTGAALAFTVVIMGGIFQILFGVFKLGKYINLVPHPVTSGFMSGIGVIIILLQLAPLLGHESAGDPINSLVALPHVLSHPVTEAFILGMLALVIVYFLPVKINNYIPSPLLALIVGTLVYLGFFTGGHVSVLGDIPSGLPSPQSPTIEPALITDMVKSAFVLALLGTIDSLLTSLVADNITRTYHNPDRELIGQGIGNTVAGFFGGLPGAGATMRTVVNVKAGGRTPVSGTLHALVLLVAVLGAGGLASYIPHAVLAGILIKVGTDIVDWDYLKRVHSLPRAGVIVMFTVFFITVFVDLITAVGVGMVMVSLLFLKRMSDLQIESIAAITEPSEETPLTEQEAEILRNAGGRILLYHFGGPLSFGAAKGMVRRLAAFKEYDVLILDLADVPLVDYTSSRALDDMVNDAKGAGRDVLIAGARPAVEKFLDRQGVFAILKRDSIFRERADALSQAARLLNTNVQE